MSKVVRKYELPTQDGGGTSSDIREVLLYYILAASHSRTSSLAAPVMSVPSHADVLSSSPLLTTPPLYRVTNGGIKGVTHTAADTAINIAIDTAINSYRNHDPSELQNRAVGIDGRQGAVSLRQDGSVHIDRRRIPEETGVARSIGSRLACNRLCMS
ncbi:uncharacterized protein MYCGRDRAFT_97763 [Zymoseptoria tritici IPO323]|uniref:Uncharacterized protein n=1 Tax=Zymoseptoria tritici (strain CBS 115943 / IPO323) TaxID=336722 RepID=F9XRA7_ZYMTI|nr:uncharacterized protein MYCGRDRAFT_97763 [Zymoseptoria tritici IPO323]EGP82242.1 hypothetical protein MYCGRDRAFT_97763 [Zymoseptoria tritici IPO323]